MRRPYLLGIAIGFALLGIALLTRPTDPLLAKPLTQSTDPVIIAAGDVANCSNWQDEETARLIDAIDGPVLALGDLAYEVGSLKEFNECYAPTWGRFKDRTRPAPGNHEYGIGNATDYFTWWGDQATPLEPGCTVNCKGYYSFDVGTWHIIALNSEIPNQAGSEQEQWLRADLAANPRVCTLAYWHRPTFSSRPRDGGGAGIDLFRALYDYGADVVLTGHVHNYERFAPQSPTAEYEPERGIRLFVVGTGGAELRDFTSIQPNSEVRNSETWGVLKMTLRPTGYDWEFIPILSQSFRDSGSSECVNPTNVPVAPAVTVTTAPAPAETTNTATTSVVAPAAPVASASIPTGGLDYVVQAGDTLSLIAGRYGLDWRQLATANQITNVNLIEVGQVIRLPGVTSTTASAAPNPVVSQPVTTTAAVASNPSPTTGARYVVRAGDTLFAIAVRNNTTWPQLAAANGLSENSILVIGQELIIPGAAAPVAATNLATATVAPAASAGTTSTTALLPTPTITVQVGVQPLATATPQPAAASAGTRTHTVAAGETIIGIAAQYGVDWRQLLQLNGLTENSLIQVGQQIRIP
jgi:LysM repeat protein